MRRIFLFFPLSILFVLSAILAAFAQSTTIENIRDNPGAYAGNAVTVTGLVTQYVHGEGNTSYYLIKGDYGAIIKVNTAGSPPQINEKYTVEGIVYINPSSHIPFISERSRSLVGEQTTAPQPPVTNPAPPPPPEQNNTLLYVLLAVVVLLVAGFFLFRSRKPSQEPEFIERQSEPVASAPAPHIDYRDMQSQSSDEFKTIRITNSSPKTLKFIPGKLTIVSGEDTGKSFMIAGYPTAEGSIVTIGREEVKGDRSYSHIQLMQKTISRKQAEIIQKDGKVSIRNLSETNYTQVDGVELKVGERAELKPGAVVRVGELELKYTA